MLNCLGPDKGHPTRTYGMTKTHHKLYNSIYETAMTREGSAVADTYVQHNTVSQ